MDFKLAFFHPVEILGFFFIFVCLFVCLFVFASHKLITVL